MNKRETARVMKPRGAHLHLGQIVWPVPDSADTVAMPVLWQGA